MNEPKDVSQQHGGIDISGDAHVGVEGDLVGGDKTVQGNEYHTEGNMNVVTIGAGAKVGQVAAGSHITQTNIVTGDEKADLADKLEQVNRRLQALSRGLDEDKQELTLLQFEKLKNELTRTEGAPDSETIQRVTNGLLRNVPLLGGPLGVVFQTSAAQKILARAGMRDWANERFK